MSDTPTASITICGSLNSGTVAALVELAMHAGAALMVQPRQAPAPPPLLLEAPVEAETTVRRKVRRVLRGRGTVRPAVRAKVERRARAAAAEPEPEPEASRTVSRDGPRELRWQILAVLAKIGEAGSSFGGLLNRAEMAPALGYVGKDQDKRIAALRNSLQLLKTRGLVERAVGQWCLTIDGKVRHAAGRDGGLL